MMVNRLIFEGPDDKHMVMNLLYNHRYGDDRLDSVFMAKEKNGVNNLIEIPPKFVGKPPVHPNASKRTSWTGAEGLAEDVRCGQWMREEAERRIGHLYPKVRVIQGMIDAGREDLKPYLNKELTVIAWLWARMVESSDPAFAGTAVPLIKSFWLSKKKDHEA